MLGFNLIFDDFISINVFNDEYIKIMMPHRDMSLKNYFVFDF